MTDHFSAIGFRTESTEALAALIGGLPADQAESIACGPGYYYRWHAEPGPELWIHMHKPAAPDGSGNAPCEGPNGEEPAAEGEAAGSGPLSVVGVTPFFAGEARMKLRAVTIRRRPNDNEFEGAVFAEIEPGEKLHECATVALFDGVDFACLAGREPPFLAEGQIAAFAHDLALFPDEAAFAKAQAEEEVRFAARSLFASGLFMPGDGASDQLVFNDPEEPDFDAPARAFVSGVVERSQMRTNPVTGQEFCWALITTLGGTLDMVATPEQLGDHKGALAPGMIIHGEFWLCGRILPVSE